MMRYEWNYLFAAACALIGYALGNFQTSLLISKRYFREDVRNHGSGNAGTTNMIRVFGLKPGIWTFAGDFLKGIAAVAVGRSLMGNLGGYIAAAFAVIGHCWPVFEKFRGGKGVATSFGIAWMIFPAGGLVAAIVAIVLFLLFRTISVCSLIATASFVVTALIFRLYDPALIVLSVLLVTLVYWRHKENIRRLLNGEEGPLKKNKD